MTKRSRGRKRSCEKFRKDNFRAQGSEPDSEDIDDRSNLRQLKLVYSRNRSHCAGPLHGSGSSSIGKLDYRSYIRRSLAAILRNFNSHCSHESVTGSGGVDDLDFASGNDSVLWRFSRLEADAIGTQGRNDQIFDALLGEGCIDGRCAILAQYLCFGLVQNETVDMAVDVFGQLNSWCRIEDDIFAFRARQLNVMKDLNCCQ